MEFLRTTPYAYGNMGLLGLLGGPGGGGSGDQCTINIQYASMRNSDQMFQATADTIKQVFNNAGVNVAFTTSAQSDPQTNLRLRMATLDQGQLGANAGKNAFVSLVNLAKAAPPGSSADAMASAMGIVAAHEWGKYILGIDNSPTGIMRASVESGTSAFERPGNLRFTAKQAKAIQKWCLDQ